VNVRGSFKGYEIYPTFFANVYGIRAVYAMSSIAIEALDAIEIMIRNVSFNSMSTLIYRSE
jgi:hypothetical protein